MTNMNLIERLTISSFQLLDVDENTRLGSQGTESVKSHPWFDTIDWKGIANHSFPVPHEITSRISQYSGNNIEDRTGFHVSPSRDVEELDTPEWLEDW
ncbi:Protein kinase domain-containing protein [Psidium guajava]|nr:Protein kinase domain-containing protein [Psidium guajava]